MQILLLDVRLTIYIGNKIVEDILEEMIRNEVFSSCPYCFHFEEIIKLGIPSMESIILNDKERS